MEAHVVNAAVMRRAVTHPEALQPDSHARLRSQPLLTHGWGSNGVVEEERSEAVAKRAAAAAVDTNAACQMTIVMSSSARLPSRRREGLCGEEGVVGVTRVMFLARMRQIAVGIAYGTARR